MQRIGCCRVGCQRVGNGLELFFGVSDDDGVGVDGKVGVTMTAHALATGSQQWDGYGE